MKTNTTDQQDEDAIAVIRKERRENAFKVGGALVVILLGIALLGFSLLSGVEGMAREAANILSFGR